MPALNPTTIQLNLRLHSACTLAQLRYTTIRRTEAKAQSFIREAQILDALPRPKDNSDFRAAYLHVTQHRDIFRAQLERDTERYIAAVLKIHDVVIDIAAYYPNRKVLQKRCAKLLTITLPPPDIPPDNVKTQAAVGEWLNKALAKVKFRSTHTSKRP
ncbi:MAG TPA: hypothetical protein VFO38_00950 [Candidatus Saccharimonadales bacterium]|nr:hypothetical protein [Candidatus Saccharimonadales bacterium]